MNLQRLPVLLGQQLYDVEAPEKCHVILGHCHRDPSGFSKDGMFEIHSHGILRDPARTKYTSKNKHNKWDQGFIIIKDGFIHNLTRKGTNWKMVLGEYYDEALMI